MDQELLTVYSGHLECPADGCFFIFTFENLLDEEEGEQLLLAVAQFHGARTHGDPGFFAPKVHTINAGMTRAAERRQRPN